MKITNTGDRGLSLIRALVHGDSGAGKTTSLGTLPEKDTVIVALERSLLPLNDRNYKVLQVESVADLREILVALRKATVNPDGSVSLMMGKDYVDHVGDFKIVAFDSLSEIYVMFVKHLIEVDRRAMLEKRGTENKDGTITPKELKIYEEMLQPEDYGLIYSRVMGLISAFNHLPIHTIFTCLTAWKDDKRTGITMKVPSLHNKLSSDIPALFDLVFHMEGYVDQSTGQPVLGDDKKQVRVWRTFNDGVFLCKDSTGKLDQFEIAHWPTIFKKILGNKKKEQADV